MSIMYLKRFININHSSNYDTEMNYYSKKSLNKENYFNFYNDNFIFRQIENINISQQTDITNNITETNTETINYVDNKYLNNTKIATVIVNPTPSLNENYPWIPGTTDNVVPGLDSLITYLNRKFASTGTLQHSITNVSDTMNNEI